MRVVSLVPSVTETLSAWGVPPVACTRFCERDDLAHVGGTKNPDVEAIVALRPDLVVVDRQENRREDAEALTGAGIDVVVLDVVSLAGLDAELDRLAVAVGVEPTTLRVGEFEPLGLRVFVPIWRRPWMTVGGNTFGSSMLDALGVANVFADADTDYPEVDLGDVPDRHPDLVLVPSEPYDFTDDHVAELATIAPPIRVDGQDLFWWGSRTGVALERLHTAIGEGAGLGG